MNISNNTAHSAYMAGDLLGAHWNLKESLPILIDAAKHARFSTGRYWAVDGLGYAFLKRVKRESATWSRIRKTLAEIQHNDRGREVREMADKLLGKAH